MTSWRKLMGYMQFQIRLPQSEKIRCSVAAENSTKVAT